MTDSLVKNVSIKSLIGVIDRRFEQCRDKKLSRFSVEWGKWSREMNLSIQDLIDSGHPQTTQLRHVFLYWTIVSKLLENYSKGSILCLMENKKYEKERQNIKDQINEGIFDQTITLEEHVNKL